MVIEISVQSNIKEVSSRLDSFQRQQLPYATSRALTRTVFQLRTDVPESMRKDMAAPVRYTVGAARYKGATKANLRASVYIDKGRLKYLQHPESGIDREPKTFGYVMIPVGLERLNGSGRVLSSRLARTYRATLLSKEDYFEATIRNTTGIWQRVGAIGPKGGRPRNIRLAVLYLPRTEYQKTWDFYSPLAKRAGSVFSYELKQSVALALATAK
jgi:hypothetical protein